MRFLFKCSWKPVLGAYRRMSSRDRNLIAVCQMTAKNNKEENLRTCRHLVEHAAQRGAKMVFLPEACDYVGDTKDETLIMAEPLDGPLVGKYRELAKNCNVWLSLGGIHERVSAERVSNAHVVINNQGEISAVYRKVHLFDVELPDKGVRLRESDYVVAGKDILAPIASPVGKVGLAICYDMRFAEMGLVMNKLGADILTYPSAFTLATGAVHWEVLLRARAIENQCYVVAAAQTGQHNRKRLSWGHAMVVDPWGSIVCQCSEGPSVAIAEVDLAYIRSVKVSMPLWQHRRNDLYPPLCGGKLQSAAGQEVYQFGQTTVKADKIFHQTSKTIAFTNVRCVVPGHVLVAPKRSVKRLADLKPEEVSDLFLVVQDVQKVVERVHNCSSSTISLQDGVNAGQTINHVHVHILPRKPGDFAQNDEVYVALEKHEKTEKIRNEDEMAEEAKQLRQHFAS